MIYCGDLKPLIDWVEKGYSTESTALSRIDEPPFMPFIHEYLPAIRYQFWSGYNTPETRLEGDWLHGFPHVHSWPSGTITLVCYLTECGGGNIAIGKDQSMIDSYEFSPEPGKCVYIEAEEWHGVRPITSGKRLTVIVTGFQN